MKQNFPITTLAAIIFLLSVPLTDQQAQAQEDNPVSHKITLGAYYSEGDYGSQESTDISYLPVSYEVARFPWIFSITVPYIAIEGPGNVFLEAGNIGRLDSQAASTQKESGIGDVLVSGTYQFAPVLNEFAYLDFSLQVKAPTADETRTLGTGEADISYQFDLYKLINSTTLFSTFGYRYRGKTTLYDLVDGAYASLGFMQQINDSGTLGLLYDYREAASTTALESHELMPFYSWEPDEKWNLLVYTIFGFTEGSADRAFGIQASYNWP